MTTDDYDALLAALRADPDDWATRAVLADWCEENGLRDEADCLHWMVSRRKRPLRHPGGFIIRASWFLAWPDRADADPESDLPAPLFEALPRGVQKTHLDANYADNAEAELALLAAWPLARAAGWEPSN